MKDIINKIKETASTLQKSTVDIANNISTVAKEQDKIFSLKADLSANNEELLTLYAEMGNLHYDSVINPDSTNTEKMDELFSSIERALNEQKDLEEAIKSAEENLKEIKIDYEKQKFQDEFDRNKEKLDKALEAKIINKDEYEEKLAQYTRKLNSFDEIKRIEEQHRMGIIDSVEKDDKINKLLNPGHKIVTQEEYEEKLAQGNKK